MSAWRPFGTGAELYLGPVRCAVYQRGDWVAEATWLGRPGSGEGVFWQERYADEDSARAASVATAQRWLRAEVGTLNDAIASAPPTTPQR